MRFGEWDGFGSRDPDVGLSRYTETGVISSRSPHSEKQQPADAFQSPWCVSWSLASRIGTAAVGVFGPAVVVRRDDEPDARESAYFPDCSPE